MTAWSGRRVRRMVALVLATYGERCHLCGHAGSDSADHLVPRSVDPSLTWDLDNLRPAHRHPCPTCGQRCNLVRGARLLPATRPPMLDASEFVR